MKDDIACPRCGGAIEVLTGSGVCSCLSQRCTAWWGSMGGLQREITARGLAKTLADPVDEDYLVSDEEGSLEWDLKELMNLTSYTTLDLVRQALVSAISARRAQIDVGMLELVNGQQQIKALDSMLSWVHNTMREYGNPNGV